MFRFSSFCGSRRLVIALLCFCLTLPVWAVNLRAAAPLASAPQKKEKEEQDPLKSPAREEFKFGKVDLELLEQVDLLDRRFERDGLVLEDEATSNYLKRVGNSLLPRGLMLENVVWKFRALRDPVPNAFALPNGSIYVSTGLLALMDNESQLAAVIAHELTHVLRRHTYLQNRSNRKKFLTMNIMAAVGAYAPGGIVGAVITVVTAVAPFIVMATIFGYARDMERDADIKGVELMMNAEYPPEEMVKMLKTLNEDIEGEQIRLFYNDHPALQERIKYVSGHIGARADTITPAMELNREKKAYFAKTESVMRHDIQLAINTGRYRSAVYLAQRLVEFRPDSAENVFWLAEAYRTLGPRSADLTTKELSNSAKKDAAKKREKRTAEEEERELLATAAGQENWKTHQQKAEELYVRALSLDNPAFAAHRGLGMLYEKLGRTAEAISQYEKYVELAPGAVDRERIQRRIEVLRRT